MGITGNLKTMELTELLQWLSQGQKTGTLVVVNKEIAKRVYFSGGMIMSSASSDPKEFLGQFLVGYGFISEEQLLDAISRQEEEKKLLGAILVDMGTISREDLDGMLRLKAEETIYSLFQWDEGDFKFLSDELPEYELVKISIDVTGIILEGMRRLDEINRMRSVIPSPDAVPVVVDEEALLKLPEMTEAEQHILQAIDDDRTVAEIALQTHAQEYHVIETLFRAHQSRTVKVVRARVKTIVEKVIERVEVTVPAQTPPMGQPMAYPYGMPQQHYQPVSVMPPGHQVPPQGAPPPSPAPPSEPVLSGPAAELVAKADDALATKRWFDAVTHLSNASNLEPQNTALQARAQKVEKRVSDDLKQAGIVDKAVPQLNVSFEELTKLDASPKAGFILSRVNGSYNIESILKISPMSPLEAKLVILDLLLGGQIRLG